MINAPLPPLRSSRWRRAPLDPVERTMRQLARQGASLARLAHVFATLMVVLFSLGSLVALSGDAVSAILVTLTHHGIPSLPQAISIAVSTLMVVCCDIGLVYAAMTLRVLRTRGADDGQALHWAVLVGVSVIEAGTYLYMSAIYEQPHGWAWGLVIARAFAAPLLSVYLSMAHPHPVTPRDILHQAELAQGIQLVRDVIRVAQDPSASLADKMRLYEASAEMTGKDKARLTRMINVVQARLGEPGELVVSLTPVGVAPAREMITLEELPNALPDMLSDDGLLAGEPRAEDVPDGGEADAADEAPVPMTRYNGRRITERVGATR